MAAAYADVHGMGGVGLSGDGEIDRGVADDKMLELYSWKPIGQSWSDNQGSGGGIGFEPPTSTGSSA